VLLIERGCILAGGRSRRFGSDKALFPLGGRPLACRLAETLAAAGLSPWLVAREPRRLGIPELLEPDTAERHPLWGVAAALEAGPALLVPVDLAGVTGEQIRALLAAAPAVAAGQPLFAALPGELAGRARELAAAGGTVRAFVTGIPEVDLGPLANLNVPPWRRLRVGDEVTLAIGDAAAEIFEVSGRDRSCPHLARHVRTAQLLAPMDGRRWGLWLAVPGARPAGPEWMELAGDEAVLLGPGTWHHGPIPLDAPTGTYLTVERAGTNADDLDVAAP
jgi:molybdopterin-guanine dinucleotide biosynthesis protein A